MKFSYQTSNALRLFIEELGNQCTFLKKISGQAELTTPEFDEFKTIAHRVKGCAGMFGFVKLSEIAAAIETAAEPALNPRLVKLISSFIAEATEVTVATLPKS